MTADPSREGAPKAENAPLKQGGLRAGERGRFLVVFRGFGLGRCGGELSVKAVGNRGSRVAWVLHQPACDDD
jgi:hypothetical protein